MRIALVLAVAMLPLLFGSLAIFGQHFFEKKFAEYGVEKNLGADPGQAHQEIMSYLTGVKTRIQLPLNAREEGHMADVKKVFVGGGMIVEVYILFILCILLWHHGKPKLILQAFRQGGIIAMALFALIGAMFTFRFDAAFSLFHTLFFQPGSWIFYPDDFLVTLYPESLFYDLAQRIFLWSVFTAFLLIVGGTIAAHFKRTEKITPRSALRKHLNT